MDIISHLPDELLLKILSLRPTAKDVVATMVLSKRWKVLWMMVPKLVYDLNHQNPDYVSFARFVEISLSLHNAPVIESLHFKLGQACVSADIQAWIRAAERHCVHELIIEIDHKSSSTNTPVPLPGTLSTCCRTLVTLKLSDATLADVDSTMSFPSLKKLSLILVKYVGDGLVNKILSSCPVLEELVVEQRKDDDVKILSVRLPSLKSLVLYRCESKFSIMQSQGFVIDAPSLEFLDIFHACGHCLIQTDMTNIVRADIVTNYWTPWKKLGSITSFKRLYLCIPFSKDVYPAGSLFSSLVHLKICTCETEWVNLLMRVLRDSPNLRALKLHQCHTLRSVNPRPCWNPSWNERSSVPECVSSRLETFEWGCYEGAEEEKEVVAFILRSAGCLKKAIIGVSSKTVDRDKKIEMVKELFSSSRRSPACKLEFS